MIPKQKNRSDWSLSTLMVREPSAEQPRTMLEGSPTSLVRRTTLSNLKILLVVRTKRGKPMILAANDKTMEPQWKPPKEAEDFSLSLHGFRSSNETIDLRKAATRICTKQEQTQISKLWRYRRKVKGAAIHGRNKSAGVGELGTDPGEEIGKHTKERRAKDVKQNDETGQGQKSSRDFALQDGSDDMGCGTESISP